MAKKFHRFYDSYYEELDNIVVIDKYIKKRYTKILMNYRNIVSRVYKLKQV